MSEGPAFDLPAGMHACTHGRLAFDRHRRMLALVERELAKEHRRARDLRRQVQEICGAALPHVTQQTLLAWIDDMTQATREQARLEDEERLRRGTG